MSKPTNDSTIICFCEEITKKEILGAIDQGYTTLKEIKQHTRAGMGQCQGRGCETRIAKLICQKTGKSIEKITPNNKRPPLSPISIQTISATEGDDLK
ncbi:hypothetical protein AKJ50_01115 [candidate division MSBL1 archaeon SCGC-AAA382A13]|uniref:SoxA A3 domain-containing protein n=1 Tax=candidate division MSBL1 archaeon SCGC-AAA382A13 TaxID=1698279 RepID=A0A133VG03_9EURY|nr:hypothetical protein AKJ50_01115 [candidate division MSBL1 archaeon SCGC-AAA382A13]